MMLAVLWAALSSAPAHAFPAVVGWGTSVVRLENPPAPRPGEARSETVVLGYKYASVSLMGLDLWTWDGAYCVLRDGRYAVITESQARVFANSTGTRVAAPFLYRFPLGLVVLAFILVVGVPFAALRRRMLDRDAPPTSLFST